MANTIVNDVTAMMAANIANVSVTTELAPGAVSEAGEFSKAFSEATGKIQKSQESSDNSQQTGSTTIDKSSTKEIKSDDSKSTDTVNNSDDRMNVAKASATAAKEISGKIKESFGISEEELENAMVNLGISTIDLLDPSKLKDLMMELSGVTDSISLITNAQAYNTVKDVMNFANDTVKAVADNFGIDVNQVLEVASDKAIMSQAMDSLELPEESAKNFEIGSSESDVITENNSDTNTGIKVEITGTPVIAEENIQLTVPATNQQQAQNIETVSQEAQDLDVKTVEDNLASGKANEAVVDSKTSDTKETNTGDANASKEVVRNSNESANLGKSETFSEVKKTEESDNQNSKGFESEPRFGKSVSLEIDRFTERSDFSDSLAGQTTQITQTEVNNVGELVETVTRYVNVDENEIVSQITESIKVNYQDDTTSLEMQLHPASLGTVNMQVSSTNGIVTAHIIVQDEAVKSALEGQLLQLQQTFEEQGHKVEAVEVSIANYDMNQQGGKDNRQNDGERKEKESFRVSGSRRRINLGDFANIGEADSDETEAETIARDMMARSGNTLDYMA